MCEMAMCTGEIAIIYEKFPWLDKIYPLADVDCAHVRDFKDISTVINASAYLVRADGTFSEIALRAACKPIWQNTIFVSSKTVENLKEDILCANQAVSAAYAVLIQHYIRCVTVFKL